MSSHPSTPTIAVKPTSVRLGELALAASSAGFVLALNYRYFPPAVLSDLWRYHMAVVGADQVVQVHRTWDLKKLVDRKCQPRLVLVTDAALRGTVAWRLNLEAAREADAGMCRPALFCCYGSRDPEEDPGPSLVLSGHPEEVREIVAFLQAAPGNAGLTRKGCAKNVRFDPALERLLQTHLQRHRDREVLRALLAGACEELRPADQPELIVPALAYSEIHALLRKASARSVEEPFDPLAVAMVNRANLYLQMLSASTDTGSRVARSDHARTLGAAREARLRTITRRELADLGHIRGPLVSNLVQFLQARPDGWKTFRQLGLAVRQPDGETWPAQTIGELAKMLRSWSEKQVRVHFHRLFLQGLITAERAADNGPWLYSLPESLSDPRSAFRDLPEPDILARATAASLPVAADAPEGPPDLPDAGPAAGQARSPAPETDSRENPGV